MLRVKKLQQFAILPMKSDSGYDLFTYEDVTIAPLERLLIGLGIACEFPNNYVAKISGVKEGLRVMTGVIDSTYREEWKILLHNITEDVQYLDAQTRIAQVLFYQVGDFGVQEVYHLGEK